MAMAEGITVDVIRTWRRRLKLPVNRVTPPVDRRRIKSLAHTERLRLYRSGLNDHEIARRLNTTRSAIVQWRGVHGLPSKYQPKAARALRKPERDEQMLKLYRLGRTDQQMAESLGCMRRCAPDIADVLIWNLRLSAHFRAVRGAVTLEPGACRPKTADARYLARGACGVTRSGWATLYKIYPTPV